MYWYSFSGIVTYRVLRLEKQETKQIRTSATIKDATVPQAKPNPAFPNEALTPSVEAASFILNLYSQ